MLIKRYRPSSTDSTQETCRIQCTININQNQSAVFFLDLETQFNTSDTGNCNDTHVSMLHQLLSVIFIIFLQDLVSEFLEEMFICRSDLCCWVNYSATQWYVTRRGRNKKKRHVFWNNLIYYVIFYCDLYFNI